MLKQSKVMHTIRRGALRSCLITELNCLFFIPMGIDASGPSDASHARSTGGTGKKRLTKSCSQGAFQSACDRVLKPAMPVFSKSRFRAERELMFETNQFRFWPEAVGNRVRGAGRRAVFSRREGRDADRQ